MSLWLKRRVVMWCAVAALLGGGWWFSSVRAQVEIPPPASTPEAAAANFMALLTNIVTDSPPNEAYMSVEGSLIEQSISRRQQQNIQKYRAITSGDAIANLLPEMVAIYRNRDYKGKVVAQNDGQAVVELQKIEQPSLPPIVCVAEDGGWRVDLIGTYAKWKGLSDLDRDVLVARLTGEVSPLLADNPEVMEKLNSARENARRSSCQSNLKQVSLGIMQYMQDYDEKLPPARDWGDVLFPYVKSQQIFHCPSVSAQNGFGFGYAYNSRLSNKGYDAILEPAQMVWVYETTDLRWNAYGLGEKRAFRHFDGANYAFADGHVKWLQKDRTPQFTFRPSNE
jgi:prepilin-type processing-associated H-X9-DG protein